MAVDGFTTVHVTTDPVEGEMLAEALRSEAIDARVEHVNSALLGAGPQLFEIRVLVAEESLAQARAILEDLRHPALAEELSTAPDEDGAPAPTARDPRKAGIGLLVPGFGHFAAGLPWTAVSLEAGICGAIAVLAARPARDFVSHLAFATIFTIMAADVVGAWRALRGMASNPPAAAASRARQIGRGVGLLGGALGGGAFVAALFALPGWLRAGDLERLAVSCTDRDITITNPGPYDRYVSLDSVNVAASWLPPDLGNRVEVESASIVRVGVGATIVRRIDPHAIDLARCGPQEGREPEECALLLGLTVQNIGASNAEPLAVDGRCLPDWSGTHRAARARLRLADSAER